MASRVNVHRKCLVPDVNWVWVDVQDTLVSMVVLVKPMTMDLDVYVLLVSQDCIVKLSVPVFRMSVGMVVFVTLELSVMLKRHFALVSMAS